MEIDQEKQKRIELAMNKIHKQFGKGAMIRMSDKPDQQVEVISTGSLGLDIALGVNGYPRGRIIEIYGPESSGKTTLTLHAIAECQKLGGAASFIDAEHSFDPGYAEALGINLKQLYFTQPSCGEEGLEIAITAIESGGFDLVVIDSVAALTPKSEIEGEMGDSKMGLHARMMSQAMRKMTAAVSRTNTTVIFINQLRDKIGVMFGCLDYDTRVVLADNTTRKIGQIVNENQTGLLVKTFDEQGNCVEKEIAQVFRNSEERVDEFLSFTVAKGRDNGRCQFRATPNHLISTIAGDVPAEILEEGDEVLTLQYKTLDEQSFQILLGGLYGDSHLKVKGNGYFSSVQNQHGFKQVAYCKWKGKLLGALVNSYSKKYNAWQTKPLLEFDRFNQRSLEWIDQLQLLGLAIMYMDDGSFHTDRCFIYKKWSTAELEVLHNRIYYLTGASGSISEKYGRITYCTAQMRKLHDAMAMHIHPSMRYKLYDTCPFDFEELPTYQRQQVEILYPMPILKIEQSTKKSIKFDIEVKDTHHYLADGVLVHNSPETTTGGNALKFYASVRLDIRRSTQIKDGEEAVGSKTKVKVVKNKVAPPFKTAEFDIIFGEGISKTGEVLDKAVELEIVKKAGSWFSYGETKLGQGREAVRELLKDNPELTDELELKIKQSI
jgi:recombination protein RecA